jgi:16S rRNA (guanine1207-N2)-methyltransferase
MPEHYFTVQPSSKLRMGLLKTTLLGVRLRFLTASGVFSHRRVDTGTRVLIDSMLIPRVGRVLDLGCGWGPIGISIAATHPETRVVMSDINRRAIWLAVENVKLNDVDAEVMWGDLYDPVKHLKFDVVVSNPPISAGRDVNTRAISGACDILAPDGTLQLVVRSGKGHREISQIMERFFCNVEEVGKKSGYRVFLSRKTHEAVEKQLNKSI